MRAILALLVILTLPSGAHADDLQHYVIDTERSLLRVLVYRAGLMSMLGHNHVIASDEITGTIDRGSKVEDTKFELSFPALSLLVDHRELRDLEGDDFSATVSDKNISGTRKNMLGEKVLNAKNHTQVRITSTSITGKLDLLIVMATVAIAGKVNSISFPASVVLSENELIVTGTVPLRHNELGLKRFSAAFGTLKVREELTIRFEIVAVPGNALVR